MAKLCVALDLPKEEALNLLKTLKGYPLIMKVGPPLFLEGGREITEAVKENNFELFLDLKLHDIPNTVTLAVEKAHDLGADYLTLHTLGGMEMLQSAVSRKGNVKLLGVTLLTSHDQNYLGFLKTAFGGVEDMVLYLAQTAKEAGLDGVVCSAGEVEKIKKRTGLITVVPGIRLHAPPQDQKRVFTPKEAVERGADIIVMGREIYRSENPKKTVEEILNHVLGR
ncbi:MAG: orotidine-5'-phosphate decarboxylase [Aquificae bacterium]|nr:orotidine-5'-phosphate decarboxylase [Aquificota bacterium]